MIRGHVIDTRRALLPLEIQDNNGDWTTLQMVLDTGFTGELALPENHTRQLGIVMNRRSRVTPATGQIIDVPAGYARVMWNENQLQVRVVQAGTSPLLGMELLWNNRIAIDAVADGAVTVTPLGG